MKLIVITAEALIDGEAMALNLLLEAGLGVLHLRKPFVMQRDVESLIRQIDEIYHPRIVLHDYYELTGRYDLKGVHLNRRNPDFFTGNKHLSVSRSCHSLDEVRILAGCDYVFLSPVFDSISKAGYKRKFMPEQLSRAKEEGVINRQVVALGGITKERIAVVRRYGFGGVAVLGVLWESFVKDGDMEDLLKRFNELNIECEKE